MIIHPLNLIFDMGYTKHKVTNPITGDTTKIWGYDNYTQAELQMQTNKMNYDMFHEQNDWNYNMWQKQNEYDSPSAQRQRLIEAGYNPLMLGDGAFSQSSPIQTASPSPMEAPDIEGNQRIEGILSAFETMVHSVTGAVDNLKNLQTTAQMPQYLFNDTQRASAEAQYKNTVIENLRRQMPWIDQMNEANIVESYANAEAQKASADTQRATKKFVQEQTAWLPVINGKTANKIDKEIEVLNEQERLVKVESNLKSNEAALCYQQMLTEKNRTAITKKESELTEKYGEQNYLAALRNYDDAHASALMDIMERYVSFDEDSRQTIHDALVAAKIDDKQDMKEFINLLQDLKEGKTLSPQQQTRWVDVVGALTPGLLGAGYIATKFIKTGARAASKVAAPLMVPSATTDPLDMSDGLGGLAR